MALILSYTRAAWISVMISLGILALVLMRIKFRYIFLVGILGIVYLTGQRTAIIHKMEKNRQTSSATLSEHVKSISNITTDESNLERIKPMEFCLAGCSGSGRYLAGVREPTCSNMLLISVHLRKQESALTLATWGMPTANILDLGRKRILGSLSFMLIALLSLMTGFRVYRRLKDKRLKQIILGCSLGLSPTWCTAH